jgi:hypothetical protein
MNYGVKVPMMLLVKKNPNQRLPCLSNREWVELRNVAMSCYVHGKSQLLHLRGRRAAADLYRRNWDECRDLWKLAHHARKVNFSVL